MLRYFLFFDYYLEYFSRRLSGKNNGNPYNNGEYKILEKLIKDIKTKDTFFFIDAGANVGGIHLK